MRWRSLLDRRSHTTYTTYPYHLCRVRLDTYNTLGYNLYRTIWSTGYTPIQQIATPPAHSRLFRPYPCILAWRTADIRICLPPVYILDNTCMRMKMNSIHRHMSHNEHICNPRAQSRIPCNMCNWLLCRNTFHSNPFVSNDPYFLTWHIIHDRFLSTRCTCVLISRPGPVPPRRRSSPPALCHPQESSSPTIPDAVVCWMNPIWYL